MNYYNTYIEFVKSRPQRDKGERHHIIPRSMGGDNHPSNLITLTPKEHWFAHKCLYKMFQGKYKAKMAYALQIMAGKRKQFNGRLYEQIRLLRTKAHNELVNSEDDKARRRAAVYKTIGDFSHHPLCGNCNERPRPKVTKRYPNSKEMFRRLCTACEKEARRLKAS